MLKQGPGGMSGGLPNMTSGAQISAQDQEKVSTTGIIDIAENKFYFCHTCTYMYFKYIIQM